jgi:hypothetical protein
MERSVLVVVVFFFVAHDIRHRGHTFCDSVSRSASVSRTRRLASGQKVKILKRKPTETFPVHFGNWVENSVKICTCSYWCMRLGGRVERD